MSKVLIETAQEETPCDNRTCEYVVPAGFDVFPARFSDEKFCSQKCRNREMRSQVQDRRRANPEKNRSDNNKRLARKYGVTEEAFGILWDSQMGRCAICQTTFDEDRPHVDHDHETGEVRGLLCSLCNPGLGFFRDDPVMLESAAAYLRRREGGDRE